MTFNPYSKHVIFGFCEVLIMKYATLKKWSGKLVILALVLCLVISMAACGKNKDNNSGKETTGATEPVGETTEPTVETTEPTVEQETIAPTEPEPPVVDTPEKVYVTMYANGAVNYRTGPGTSYEKKGSLSRGDAVQVVKDSLTENGWYEAQIDGEECYLYGSYLSTTKPSEDSGSGSKDDTPSSSGSSTGTTKPSGNTGSSAGGDSASGGSTGNTAGAYVGPADTSKGVSWDGVSPIVYTYTDGTTGTKPKEGATYESKPGITTTYTGYVVGSNATGSVNGVFYCEDCGKVCGNGSDGTCVSWLTAGDHTCSCCGATVPSGTCHTCKEN